MQRSLLEQIAGKSVIIWGARIVGIGLSRRCKNEGIEVLSFIDSDESLWGKTIGGASVVGPHRLNEMATMHKNKKLALVVAVSIKEDEIKAAIRSQLCNDEDIDVLFYKDFNSVYYTIDVVSSCNLKCLSCAHSMEGKKPGGMMRIEDVKRVIEKILHESPNCSHVSLYSWGEPLIHPQIGDIIRLFHDAGIAVGLSTNLSHTDFKKIENAVNAEPDYLKISVSGYYPTAYNNTHQGGDITLVKSNLYRLAYLMRTKGIDSLVDVNYHLYRDNCGDNLKKMRELASELGFVLSTVYALVMPLERVLEHTEGNTDWQTTQLQENLLVSIDEGIEASRSVPLENGCPFKHNQMNINADLTVPTCCVVFDRKYIVSDNYLESSLEEINSMKENAEVCSRCMELDLPQYNMGFNRDEWKRIAESKKVCDIGSQ